MGLKANQLVVAATKKRDLMTGGMCLTPACVHASSEILYNLSPDYKNIDPCTNFEELVCGGWDERHDLRPDQGDAFTGTIMSENSQMLLRHILEAPYPDESKVGSTESILRCSNILRPDCLLLLIVLE